VKLKRHGGGMRRCKMLLRSRNSALDVCVSGEGLSQN
jgi:hypothetical protein